MRARWNLSTAAGATWTLTGWRQNDWEFADNFVRVDGRADVPGVAASVPGSVRGALTAAGVTPAPWAAEHSRDSEWIENRHWTYDTVLTDEQVASVTDPEADPQTRLVLCADSLDFAGSVLLGATVVGTFEGAALPLEFDLTDAVRDGQRNLRIAFTRLPDDIGQIGRTSLVRDWKARFNYGWDWTPRIVQIGIAGPIALETRVGDRLTELLVSTDLVDGAGVLRVQASSESGSAAATLTLTGPGGLQWEQPIIADGSPQTHLVPGVQPWHDHTTGDQPLYELTVALPGQDEQRRTVGFRSITWEQCEGAPAGAEPWICVVNGTRVFLGGINWVPIRPDYADVTQEQYRERMETYRGMGVVVLRVWGGALREQDEFYRLADELGFLLWQELPLSSSGLDNTPPADPELAGEFAAIAASYVRDIGHHASIILWGGGNELTDPLPTDGTPPRPLDDEHPIIAPARKVFTRDDPGRRFVTTSPTGPRVWGDPAEFGTGVHHDVHGPWETAETPEQWRDYWDRDDALIRSEVGMGGASDLALLREFDLDVPVDTEADRVALQRLWSHSSAWWLGPVRTWDWVGGMAAFVDYSQQRQAELLGYAAKVTRDRFPRVGGFIVWLGHDTFPCAVSLSVLDFHGHRKPVADALAAAFRSE